MMRFIDLGFFGTERLAVRADKILRIDLNELVDDEGVASYTVVVQFSDNVASTGSFATLDAALAAYWRLFEQLNTETYPVATPAVVNR